MNPETTTVPIALPLEVKQFICQAVTQPNIIARVRAFMTTLISFEVNYIRIFDQMQLSTLLEDFTNGVITDPQIAETAWIALQHLSLLVFQEDDWKSLHQILTDIYNEKYAHLVS